MTVLRILFLNCIIQYTKQIIFYYIMNPAELKLVFVVAVAVPAQLVFAKNDLDRAQLIRPQGNNMPGGQTQEITPKRGRMCARKCGDEEVSDP